MRYYSKLSISLALKCHTQNGVGVGNWVGAWAKSVASCFTHCSFALLSALGVAASRLIRWMDGPDFRAGESGKGQGRCVNNGQGL